LAGRDRSAKIAPPAGPEAEGQPAWGARRGSDSASASTCAHLPRTTSSTFVAADETARIRNEQRASNLWCDPGRGLTCVRCYTSSCALVAPAVTAAANRGPTESGVIGAAGVRGSRVCRVAEIHSYGSYNPTAGAAARPARAGTADAGAARARCHSAGYSHNIAITRQPLDVCARYGGHRVNFMRGHHAMWRCDYPRHR
jgi:hypothetical protein